MTPNKIGPYLIVDKLGAGGMGSVYLGRHIEDGTEAAVKVLSASLAHEEGFVERFNREIESMKRLSNPHIVALYDSGIDEGNYYYTMEYVPGETLTGLLRREKRVSWERAIDIGIQICQALKAAHDAGIVHRDLKPSNLLITTSGLVKLTDFGVAQVFASGRLTVTGGIVGTAEFMSPEQAQGKRATRQSDLYSLGAVLYALVTGRPPFSGSSAVDVMNKHKFGLFDAPGLIVPDMPHWLDEIICQLLEKEPDKRFPDALVVSRKLEQVLRKVELAEGMTTAEVGGVSADDETAPASLIPGGPGPATIMKHLLRAELEAPGSALERFFNNTWVLVSLLVMVIAGGVVWYRNMEVSPEEKLERGLALMEQPAGPDWLRARDEYFQPLLDEDPEKYKEQLSVELQKIEDFAAQDEIERTLKSRRRRPLPADDAMRFLMLAHSYRSEGELGKAEQTLDALSQILANDPERKPLFDLCARTLETWREETDAARFSWVQEALQRADKLAKSEKRDDAAKIWQSVVALYADDPRAQKYVNQARQALTQEQTAGL